MIRTLGSLEFPEVGLSSYGFNCFYRCFGRPALQFRNRESKTAINISQCLDLCR